MHILCLHTHFPLRNPAVLEAVRNHQVQGRHWTSVTYLFGYFAGLFNLDNPDDFKRAGSDGDWQAKCGAVVHNRTLYVPPAGRDYEVRSAHKLVQLLMEDADATRCVVLARHDKAKYNIERENAGAKSINSLIQRFNDNVLAALDPSSTRRATPEYRSVLGSALKAAEIIPHAGRRNEKTTTVVVDTLLQLIGGGVGSTVRALFATLAKHYPDVLDSEFEYSKPDLAVPQACRDDENRRGCISSCRCVVEHAEVRARIFGRSARLCRVVEQQGDYCVNGHVGRRFCSWR